MGRLPVRTVTSDMTVSMAAGGGVLTQLQGPGVPLPQTPTSPWGVHGASASRLS